MTKYSKTRQIIAAAMLPVLVLQLLWAPHALAAQLSDSVGSFKIAADLSRRSSQELAVKQAVAIITNYISTTPDADGDPFPEPPPYLTGPGPVGGGLIPVLVGSPQVPLGAPIADAYGSKLGYCAWDNGAIFTSGLNRLQGSVTDYGAPTFAVISAGLNGTFERTCAQISSGAATNDDDFVVVMSTNQIRQGLSGTIYFGDPVATTTILNGLLPSDQKDGELRLVKADNTLWRWDSTKTSYVAASASPFWSAGTNPGQAATAAGISQVGIGTSNPGYALEIASATIPLGLRSSGQYNGVNFLNGTAVSGFVGYDNTASRLFLNGLAGSTIDFAIGGATQLQVAANGRVIAQNGLTVNNGLTIASGTLSASNVAVTGGSINGTAIGNVTPSTAAFTTLSGTLTGNVSGNAATASRLQAPVSIGMSGDVNWSVSFDGSTAVSAIGTLSNTGVTAGAYGSATSAPTFTVDARGRLLTAANILITPAFSSITGTPTTATGYGIASIDAVPIGTTTASTGAFTSVAANNGVSINGGNLVLNSANISAPLAARPVAGIANRIFIATDTNEIFRDTGTLWIKLATGNTALSSLTAAAVNNTITNGTNAQAWNWSLTANNTAFNIGENAASTGGTGTQYLTSIGTLAASTAIPLSVSTRGSEAFRVDSVNPQIVANPGSAAAPSYTFNGSQSTGFYSPVANELGATLNGARAMRISAGSMGLGQGSLLVDTSGSATAFGTGALAANTTGARNTGLGYSVLTTNTTGANNTATGFSALTSNTSGNSNTATGTGALQNNTTAQNNTAVGLQALNNNNGNENTAAGVWALRLNTTGVYNSALGNYALSVNTSGSDNSAVGGSALTANTTGGANVAVGKFAGQTNATGSFNTLLGSFADVGTNALNYATAIGAFAQVSTANTVVLGRTTDKTVIGATGDDGTAYNLQVTGGIKALTGGLRVAGGDLVLNSTTVTGLLSARPVAGVAGRIYIATDTNQLYRDDGTSWNIFSAGNVALSSLTAATANNTINNGANAQVWNWNLSTNTTAFNIGENVASTSGTGTQYLANIGTLAASTAIPLRVATRGIEAFRVDSINPQIVANIGTAAAPSYTFNSTQNTGFYSPAANELGASINGARAMRLTGGSVGLGLQSMQNDTSGSATAVGYFALSSNTTAVANVAVGFQAMLNTTTGGNNVALGYATLQSNSIGNLNTALGSLALNQNTTGAGNSAIGGQALQTNSTGANNNSIGVLSMFSNTGGSGNQAIGMSALKANTIGNNNVALGQYAGWSDSAGTSTNANTTGSNNTFIGTFARSGTPTQLTYATAIGSDAQVGTINTIVLGRTTDKTVIGATGDDLSAYNLQVTGGIKALTGGLQVAGGDLVLNSATVTNTLLARPAAGVAGRIYIATDTNEIFRDTGTAWIKLATGNTSLSSLTAAVANNTISNGASAQAWNWSLAANSTAFNIGETVASTGGTGAQYLHTIGTLPASTAIPLSVSTRGVEAFRVDSINPQLVANSGTAAAPAYSFAGQQSTGLYLPAAGQLGASVAGTRSLWITAGSLSVGQGALAVDTSAIATAFGTNALAANTSAANNAAFGFEAAKANSSGVNVTAVGYKALWTNTTGSGNVAIGSQAMINSTTGGYNIAVGSLAISSNTSGDANTAIGDAALSGNTIGYANVAIGAGAGFHAAGNVTTNKNISGTNNTFIGTNALPGTTTQLSYATALGSDAQVSTANTVVLGRTTDKTVIGAAGTDGTTYSLQVTGGIKALTGGMSIAAGDLVLDSINVSGTLAARPAFGVANRIYIATDTNEIYRDTGASWTRIASGTPTSALSGIVAATANNSIANGSFTQTWNWAQTANSTAFAIGESAAATGGTGTQYLHTIGTLAASTAIPLSVSTRGAEAFRVDSVNPQVVANNGTIAAPSYSFAGQQSTGFYLPAAGQLGASVGNNRSLWITGGSTSVGIGALLNDSAATNNNSAFGNSALASNAGGTANTAIGTSALFQNTSGANNVAVGRSAGQATSANVTTNGNTTGSNNTFLGAYAMPGTPTQLSYATAIGSDAIVSSSNTIVLGRSTDKTVIGAANTDGGSSILQVQGRAGAVSFIASAHTPVDVQGAYLQWNRGNGDGRTYLVNQRGLGYGGISFGEATTADAYTQTMAVDANGNFTAAGTISAAVGSGGAPSYTFNGFSNTGFYMGSATQLSAVLAGTRAMVIESNGSSYNTGFGMGALNVGATGTLNAAFGGLSLYNVSSGTANTAIGVGAQQNTTTGSENTMLGFNSGYSITAGNYNVAVGLRSIWKNTISNANTGIGYQALEYTTGANNVALGYNAAQNLTSGTDNIAIGNAAGNTVTNPITGNFSTFIGSGATVSDVAKMAGSGYITLIGAGSSASGLLATQATAYMTALGAGASVTSVNTVVLGRTTDSVAIGQTSAGGYKFTVNGTAGGTSAYAVSSDRRFKTNITPVINAVNTIKSLEGVHYEFNRAAFPEKNFETGRQLGFIAQQIENFVPEVVRTDSLGFKSVQYSQLVPLLAEGIKEQQLVLQYLVKKDPTTLLVDIKTFQANDAIFANIKSTNIKTANLEAESARIKKLDADRIESRYVRSDVMKTGEVEIFVSLGSFQPIFNPQQNSQYIVNATAEDGSSAFASVAFMSGRLTVTPISGKGVDVTAIGGQVGLVAASKKVKATWIRMS